MTENEKELLFALKSILECESCLYDGTKYEQIHPVAFGIYNKYKDGKRD